MLLLIAVLLPLQTSAQKNPATPLKSQRKAQPAKRATPLREPAASELCAACIRAELSFLASDAMRGRGSGTHDEQVAATYVGTELERYGIAPAGDKGTYIQTATISKRSAAAPPVMSFTANGHETHWTHGDQFVVPFAISATDISAPLQKISKADEAKKGAFVLVPEGTRGQEAINIAQRGALAVLVPASAQAKAAWPRFAKTLPRIGSSDMGGANVFMVNDDAAKALSALPDGTTIAVHAETGPEEQQHTWNALGILRGSSAEADQVILLSAHLDHLGIGQPVNGDEIYNGADDDASGTVAVLQLARALGAAPKPKRTVVFALFGSEETGGVGSHWFLEHPPVPLTSIVANLEFEMIGRADPAVKPDELWLTGWERTNLGPALAQHGAKLVGDPHPAQNFFARSDNIVLARRGVVAQTVSSFGLHPQYHRPDDDLAHINFDHMDRAIQSMIAPVRWLVNSDFKPEWLPGKKP